LARNGANRCGPFVLISARKSRGGEWSPDDYDVRDSQGKVVGRIMLHPQAPKDQPWFWTINGTRNPAVSLQSWIFSDTRTGDGGFQGAVVGDHQLSFIPQSVTCFLAPMPPRFRRNGAISE
jgi:hypothetical protein